MQTGNYGYVLMTLDEFKDWLFGTTFNRSIKVLQQHHTAEPSYNEFNGSNHFSMVYGMRQYHMQTNGWSDIAQNITIFPDGMIMICRPFDKSPAGIAGCNSYGLCMENVGYFDVGGDDMTEAHMNTIVAINALLCIRFELTPSVESITYHRWWDLSRQCFIGDNKVGTYKTCPGTNWFGGNSISAAQNNFYPLIFDKINEYNGVSSVPAMTSIDEYKKITAATLNIRQLPNTSATVVGQLSQGEIVHVVEVNSDGTWFKVSGNVTGYIAVKYTEYAPKPLTFADYVQKLVTAGIIGTPTYWINNAILGNKVDGNYALLLITRATKTTNIKEATTILVSKGVISSPDYWIAHTHAGDMVEGSYMNKVIVGIATKML